MSNIASRYVDDDGVEWLELVRDSVGTVVLFWFLRVAEVVDYYVGVIEKAIKLFAWWLEDLVEALVLLPLPGMRRAMESAASSVETYGLAAYIVAIALLAVTILVFIETVVRVAGGS